VLHLRLDEFTIELDDGTIQNVGGPTKSGTAKLFEVGEAEARAFGDRRVKLAFADDDGSEVEVALDPADLETLLDDVAEIRAETDVLD
jgi:hypothetical protein